MRTSTRCNRDVPRGRTRWASGIKIFLMLFLLGFLSKTSFSQTITIDGNPSTQTGEWCDPVIKHIADKYNQVNQDNIFAGNEKDFMFAVPDWHWKLGTAKDKNDIANGAAVLVNSITYKGSLLTGSTYLAFAGDRITNDGDAQIGFWFFQKCTSPVAGGNFSPEKTIGDLLVLADFTGGGREATVTVLQWVGSGGNYSESSAFNVLTTSAGVAENNNTVYPVPCGWNFTDKKTGTNNYNTKEFFEGFVDLGTLGSGAACFSCFMLETRSSQEITATLDDFVGGPLGGVPSVTVNSQSRCSNGAAVTLTATPGSGTAADYTYAWTGPGGFTASTQSINVTAAGQYCVVITNKNGCASEPGCGTVTVNDAPTADAGEPQAKCQTAPSGPTSFTLAGTATNGSTAWSVVGSSGTASATIATPSSLTSTVSVAGIGTVTLRLTTTSTADPSCGTATDDVVLTVNENPTANAGSPKTDCRAAGAEPNTFGTNTFTVTGTGTGGDVTWSVLNNPNGYSVNIVSPNSLSTNVQISGNVNGGSVTLQLAVKSESCGTATSTVTLTLTALPIIYRVVGTDFCPSAPNTGTITLSGSEIGVNYQLRKDGTPEGDVKEGTGNPLVWNNLGSGTYDVLATRIGTSCSTTTGSDDVAQNNAPDPSVKNLTSCEDGSTGGASFNLNNAVTSADGGTLTFYTNSADAQAGTNSISASQTVTVAASPKTFWVRSENTTTGCYGFSSFTVTVTDNPDVTTKPLTSCESGISGAATFNLSSGVVSADGGSLTFYTSQADANGATNAIADPANYVAHNGDVIYVRSTNGTCFGTASFTITVTDNPDVTAQNIAGQCNNPSTGTATVDLNSGVISPDGGTVTFHISQVDANTGANAILNPANYVAHDGDVIYVRSANGSCFGTTSFTITVSPCQTTFNCSYTMGFYGNPGGKACDGNAPQTTLTLINQLIGDGFTLGRADLNKSVVVPAGSGQKIIDYLPVGGPAAVLNGNCNVTTTPSCLPAKNVLLGQTITLKLNMGLNGGSLAGFDLAGHGGQYLVTQKRNGCGENATVVSCVYNPGAIQSFWINDKVVSYLEANYGGALVSDLMELANDALGGALPKASATVPSLSEINSVIDAINRGFDECRSFVKFSACEVTCVNAGYPDPCNPPIVSSRTVRELSSQMASSDNNLTVSAYPNPYTDVVKFTIQSNVSGKAQLEVVNMLGQRIATIYNGYVQANKGQIVEYKVPTAAQQTLIYVLTVGDRKVTGKVLKANK